MFYVSDTRDTLAALCNWLSSVVVRSAPSVDNFTIFTVFLIWNISWEQEYKLYESFFFLPYYPPPPHNRGLSGPNKQKSIYIFKNILVLPHMIGKIKCTIKIKAFYWYCESYGPCWKCFLNLRQSSAPLSYIFEYNQIHGQNMENYFVKFMVPAWVRGSNHGCGH